MQERILTFFIFYRKPDGSKMFIGLLTNLNIEKQYVKCTK